jgi:hypothetical protein
VRTSNATKGGAGNLRLLEKGIQIALSFLLFSIIFVLWVVPCAASLQSRCSQPVPVRSISATVAFPRRPRPGAFHPFAASALKVSSARARLGWRLRQETACDLPLRRRRRFGWSQLNAHSSNSANFGPVNRKGFFVLLEGPNTLPCPAGRLRSLYRAEHAPTASLSANYLALRSAHSLAGSSEDSMALRLRWSI